MNAQSIKNRFFHLPVRTNGKSANSDRRLVDFIEPDEGFDTFKTELFSGFGVCATSATEKGENDMTIEFRRRHADFNRTNLIRTIILVWTLVLFPSLAHAGFGNDYVGCAADRPCFNGARQSGSKIIFQFTGVTGWDFYNVRYAQVGGGEKQVENRSGSFTFNNVKPNRIYRLKVQGCNSHTLARSTCSPWVEESVTTR